MAQELNAKAFGLSLAIISALYMLLLGVFGNLGVYTGSVEQMQQWHLFFSLSIGGIITGMLEAAVWGFVGGWLVALVYNRFT